MTIYGIETSTLCHQDPAALRAKIDREQEEAARQRAQREHDDAVAVQRQKQHQYQQQLQEAKRQSQRKQQQMYDQQQQDYHTNQTHNNNMYVEDGGMVDGYTAQIPYSNGQAGVPPAGHPHHHHPHQVDAPPPPQQQFDQVSATKWIASWAFNLLRRKVNIEISWKIFHRMSTLPVARAIN